MKGFHVEKINELQGFDGLLNGYLDLDHVEVPVENRLSEEGQGWWILVSGLNFERLVIGAQQVGLLRELARYVAFYTRRRVQFNQPTFEYEANQYKLADIIIDYRITRLLTYYTAYLMDQGVDPVLDANVLKAFSTEAVEKASRDAIQAMGGDGWTKFYPVEAIYRNAKLGTIGGGTSEVLKRFIVRYALTAMTDDLKTPIRISHPELKVPITVSEKSITKEKLQGGEEGEMEILRVLARDYLVNPGLFMELNDIKRFIECDEKQLVEIINSLEAKGLVKVLRDRDKPRLVKATYDGLRKAYPREYYMYFPRWVKEKMSEYIF
nr:acyl-CoA dehydrogenase [Sulfolobus islandicus]